MSTIAYRSPTITRLTSADAEPEREPDFLQPGDFHDVISACVYDALVHPAREYIACPEDAVWRVWKVDPATEQEGGAQ